MKPEPLLDAHAKIEWAETHIDHLNAEIVKFFETSPYELTSKVDSKQSAEIWRFRLTRPFPREVRVTAGAILHALRSPLDQTLSAIALQSHKSDAGVGFPFGQNEDEFKRELRKQKKLPPDAIALISEAKPYKGGNDLLWQLHHLNRRDKHRAGLVPINLHNAVMMTTLVIFCGRLIRLGFPNGTQMIPDANNNLSAPPDRQPMIVDKGQIIRVNGSPAARFTPGPGDDDMEVLATVPGTEFYCDVQPSLDVAFRNVEGLEHEPVVAVLHQMSQLVQRILLTFERRFFA
jgi:hypothetical protein